MSPAATGAFADKPTIDGYRHGRVPRAVREQQMLDVAEEVFTELGFDAASIEEICRRANLKRPLFYTYFGGKDGLYLACYRRARGELEQRLAAAAAEGDPEAPGAFREAVGRLVRTYFEFLADAPSRWDMLYGPGAATAGPVGEEIAKLRFGTVDLLAAVIKRYSGSKLDDRTLLAFAHATSGTAEQMARFWRRVPGNSIDEVADVCARFIWSGLSQVESKRASAKGRG